MSFAPSLIKRIFDAALMAAQEPLSLDQLIKLFKRGELEGNEGRRLVREALQELERDAAGKGWELKRVASGYRYQVRAELAEWVRRLWQEKPPRYSRALLETLALIAYQQPVTRGDIERVRGVAVSHNIMRALLERGWIRVVGQREAPGRPSMYGTTRAFLDYFNLRTLEELPPLEEIKAMIEPPAADQEASAEAPPEAGETPPEAVQAAPPSASGAPPDAAASAQRLAEVVPLPTSSR